jgi:coenzyme F420-reducing hydrogenase gamma subunit
MTPNETRPVSIAVWKFASCDGCQLSLLDCEDDLLALADQVNIAHFLEASKAQMAGPYDVSIVEGSITTSADLDRIRQIRENSGVVVAIGACATAGGIQALRNFADVAEFASVVYAKPEYVSTLTTSTPASAHIHVDFELAGCPIDRRQLLDTITALIIGRRPALPGHSVCFECKARGTTCVLVANGTPCLGPVTRAGCGALCPSYARGCYGCFGPAATTNTDSLVPRLQELGMPVRDISRVFSTFNVAAQPFTEAAATVVATTDPAAEATADASGRTSPDPAATEVEEP